MSGNDRNLFLDMTIWVVLAGAIVYAATRMPGLERLAGQFGKTVTAAVAKTDNEPAAAADVAAPADQVELRADQRGHFLSDIDVNGRTLAAMVDTGATMVVLSYEDAERAGIFLRERDFTLRTQTANGIGKAAPIVLDRVSVGAITIRGVEAAVLEPGVLQTSLLGMSFLKRLQRFEVRSGRLVLQD